MTDVRGDSREGVARKPVIVVRDVAKVYRKQRGDRIDEIRVLENVNLEVMPGERVAIRGQSGVGKTTLLNLLGGLDRPDEGRILHEGRPLPDESDARVGWRRGRVGFIFQFHGLLPEFTAAENVALAGLVCGRGRRDALRQSEELLARVGLGERSDHYPDELSGGEQQRVSIARALLVRPRVVLADEPTGNLDPRTGDRILELLIELQEESEFALVVASHSERLARRCHRILEVVDGRLETNGSRAAATAPREPT